MVPAESTEYHLSLSVLVIYFIYLFHLRDTPITLALLP